MRTTLRVLMVAAVATVQWWSVASQQPAVHVVDTVVRQVARPDALASVLVRIDCLVRSLRSGS
jgi:hypothetical protein